MLTIYAQTINYEVYNPKADYNFDFVYLHGELEEENGFDLTAITYQIHKLIETIDSCKADVDVVFINGKHEICNMYFWRDEEHTQHGLICRKSDTVANADALDKFNRKVNHL